MTIRLETRFSPFLSLALTRVYEGRFLLDCGADIAMYLAFFGNYPPAAGPCTSHSIACPSPAVSHMRTPALPSQAHAPCEPSNTAALHLVAGTVCLAEPWESGCQPTAKPLPQNSYKASWVLLPGNTLRLVERFSRQ